MMSKIFAKRKEPVDLIVSSPANRAITTAKFFANELGITDNSFRTDPRIYEASVRALLEVVNDLPDECNSVMLFGHNPGFIEVVEALGGASIGELSTCAIARIDLLMDDWKAAGRGTGSLAWLDYPKRHEV